MLKENVINSQQAQSSKVGFLSSYPEESVQCCLYLMLFLILFFYRSKKEFNVLLKTINPPRLLIRGMFGDF